jgi:hypothetical protein
VTGPVLLVLASVLAVAAGALAWAHVRRVIAVVRPDTESIALALKRVPASERLTSLRDRAAAGSWEHDLAADVLAAPDEEAKVAAVNLALADIEHALVRGERWPAAALRIALLGGGLLAILAKLLDPGQLRWTVAIIAVDGLAAMTCAHAARIAARHADRQRRAVDALVAAALTLPPEGRVASAPTGRGGPSPSRQRRRGGS